MHDFDRTTLETGYNEFEHDELTSGEFEYEHDEAEADLENYGGMYGKVYAESPFNEAEEMELAAELLSVNNEAEGDEGSIRSSRSVRGI